MNALQSKFNEVRTSLKDIVDNVEMTSSGKFIAFRKIREGDEEGRFVTELRQKIPEIKILERCYVAKSSDSEYRVTFILT